MFNQTAFITVVWTFFVLAASSTFFRFTIQTSLISKPYDSILSHLALVILLVNAIANTVLALTCFQLSQGHANIILTSSFFQLQFACTTLNTTCLWLVKASFLASYYSLIDSVIPLRRAWFMIMGMTISAYACCITGYPFSSANCIYGCIAPNLSLSSAMLWLSTVWDIVSNLFLIAFPLTILLRTSQTLRSKYLAAFGLSLCGIIVVLAIARVTTSYAATGLSKVFGLHLWGAAQCGLFLFINNCLAISSKHRENQQSRFKKPVEDIRYTTSLPTGTRLQALHDSLQQRIKSMDDTVSTHPGKDSSIKLPSNNRLATQDQTSNPPDPILTNTSLQSPISFCTSQYKRPRIVIRTEPTSTFSWSSDESEGRAES